VLVVDDEPNIIRLIEYHLRSAGYLVHSARDGSEALASVHEVRPAIIVLDVMMPGLDGWTVLQALKSDPETAAIPVLMLTALGSDDHVRRSWQKGTDFHLCKPFNPVELVSVVHRLAVSLDSPDAPPPLRRWLK
jgi:CheY-like chemotaxis protein